MRRAHTGLTPQLPLEHYFKASPRSQPPAALPAAAAGTTAPISAVTAAESLLEEATPHQGRRTRRRTTAAPESTPAPAATADAAEWGAHPSAPLSRPSARQEPSGQDGRAAEANGDLDAEPRPSQQLHPDEHHHGEGVESDVQPVTPIRAAPPPYGPLVPGGVSLAAFLASLGPAAARAAPLVAPPVVPDMMVDPVGFRSRADLASAVLEGVRQPAAAPAWAEEYYLPAQYPTQVELELLSQLWNDLPTARDIMGPPLMPEEQEAGDGEDDPGGAAGARLEVAMQRMAEHAATSAAAGPPAAEEQVGEGVGSGSGGGGDAVGRAEEETVWELGGGGDAVGAEGVQAAGAGGSETAGMGYVGGPAEAGEAAVGLPPPESPTFRGLLYAIRKYIDPSAYFAYDRLVSTGLGPKLEALVVKVSN